MDRRRGFAAATVATVAVAMNLAVATALAADRTVTIAGFAFSPKTVNVNVGDAVTWTNNDGTTHTATGSGFNTGDIAAGASKSITFQSAGTFDYICAIHPTMTGAVVVRAAGGGSGTPNTDMESIDTQGEGGWLTPVLALLGLVLIAGTVTVDRLLRRRSLP
jgi:plastocyanin